MNIDIPSVIAVSEVPIMLKISYWVLILFWAFGAYAWSDNPNRLRATNALLIVLFAIVGYVLFGF